MEAGKRLCKFCGRSFPNGKSLGGHMKLHLSLTLTRGADGAGTSSPKPRKKNKAPLSSSTGEEYQCFLCGNTFMSWRSYRGHIRWHELRYESEVNMINERAGASEDPETNHAAQMLVGLSTMDCSCNYEEFSERFGLKKKHECMVCEKDFPTGQALGGHRGNTAPASQDADETRVLEEKHELGFDLNVEPPEDVSPEPSDDKVVVGKEDDANIASNQV